MKGNRIGKRGEQNLPEPGIEMDGEEFFSNNFVFHFSLKFHICITKREWKMRNFFSKHFINMRGESEVAKIRSLCAQKTKILE